MKVTLKKPHTHAGKEYEPGQQIDVDESTAAWLAEQCVIELGVPRPAAIPTPDKPAPVAGKE